MKWGRSDLTTFEEREYRGGIRRKILGEPIFLFFLLLLPLVPVRGESNDGQPAEMGNSVEDAGWSETARTWEETARRLEAFGDTEAVKKALAQAALAWENAGRIRAEKAEKTPERIDELEKTIAILGSEIESWRNAAQAWRDVAETWRRLGDEATANQALGRSKTALKRAVERELLRERYQEALARKRRLIINRPVSDRVKRDLVERWAEVARSWEETARSWEASGDSNRATVAHLKAEDARNRIREIDPTLDEAWFQKNTGLREREVVSVTRREIGRGAAGEQPLRKEKQGRQEIVKIPELEVPLHLPPQWLLVREEREMARQALVWRENARAWHQTAATRARSGDGKGVEEAVREMKRAEARARRYEEAVRKGYAAREVKLDAEVAAALGTEPRTETDVLKTLDAAAKIRKIPPALTSEVVSMAPPPVPGQETAPQKKRGFFDLEIGGPLPSTLTIRGRKVVSIDYSVTHYPEPNPNRIGGNTQSNFSLNQELQVEVLGRVGKETNDHININIRFDDTQRGVNAVNNRDIGVDFVGVPHHASWGTYQYDFDFGDISVSLPNSQFALYNKSLFGAKGNLNITNLNLGPIRADKVSLIAFGSQTKGVSASKEFTLSGERVIEDIRDVDFARDRFFQIEPDASEVPISDVVVYRDDQIGSNNEGALVFTASGFGPTAGFNHTGNWNQLTAGIDYTVNLITGELEMLTSVSANDVLAVSYKGKTNVFGQGGLPPRLIRVPSDTSSAVRALFRIHELRNRYVLKRRRIKKDDPNFVFEIRDQLGFTQTDKIGGVPTSYLQIFNFDRDRDDKLDIELIDYDFGVIRLLDTAPFAGTGNAEVDNDAIYNTDDLSDVTSKYTIHIEYSSDQPQEIFSLGFDIIKGSDIVYVDGVKVERDRDYFIDYEAGVITFLNRSLLKPESKIRVDYEFLPFGGQVEQTLAGTRLDVDVNPKLSFGTTLLYNFSAEAREVPTIFEDKPTKSALAEVDARMDIAGLLLGILNRKGESSFLNKVQDKFRLSASGEYAWSALEPNTFGSALVEDFEAIENIVSAAFGPTSWGLGSRSPALNTALGGRGDVTMQLNDNFGHLTLDQLTGDEKQSSLQFNLSFGPGDTWVSVQQAFSSAAIDFSDMTALEFFVSGLPSGMRVFVDVGLVSEDADEDGILDSEDVGLDGKPGTGDVGEQNGVLNTGEDIGIDIGGTIFGQGNGSLTTEDMDGDFFLDQREAFFQFADSSTELETQVITGIDNSQWTLFRYPFRSGIAVGDADSKVIKHVRLVFVRSPDRDTNVTLFIDQLNFRGSRFVGAANDTRLAILPRNNLSDANFLAPNLGEVSKGDDSVKEQALALKWDLAAGESITVKQPLQKKMDISDYQRLSFFLAGDARGETVSLFLVSDADDYIEIRTRVTNGTDLRNGAGPIWNRLDVPLDPIQTATISNILGRGDSVIRLVDGGEEIFIVGRPEMGRSPSLANINELWIRIQSEDVDSGEIWIDDIYVAEPKELSGAARTASFSTGWGDLWSLNGSWRDVPGKFRGVGFINNPQASSFDEISQDAVSLHGSIALHRLLPERWKVNLPLTASWSRSTTTTDPNRVENTLKSNLGKTRTENQAYTLTAQIWKFPSVNLSYGRTLNTVDFRAEDRTDKNSSFHASTGYSYVFPRKIFGIIPTGKSLSVNSSYSYSLALRKSLYGAGSGRANVSVNSRTANQNLSVGITSRPINPLSLSYNYTTAFLDRRTLIASERWKGITSRSHSVTSNLNLPTFFGFSPGVTFTGRYNENFNRATFGGKNKDAALGGDFRVSVGINPSVWTKLLSFLTVNYNYSLSSNASYRQLDPGTNFGALFGDYVGERVFPWGSSKRIGKDAIGVAAFRTSGSTNITHSISGGIKTFRWLQTSYSTSLSRNEVASLSTLSITDGLQATLNSRMNVKEAIPWFPLKFRSSYLTGAVSYGQSENAASRTVNISPSMNWNIQWTDALNTTFTLGWNRSSNLQFLNPQAKTINTSLTPAMNFTYYFDLPEYLQKSALGKFTDIQRRVQLSGGINGSVRKSLRGGLKTQDQNTLGFNLGLGYRISSNLEMSASGNGSWFSDRLERLNDRITFGGNARVEWRF
ncbi:MAG: hypothetical protein D6679_00470 [Candidatus Hydrogenedentota bacterium]|nr:MAG: hypothetical protein D6679_00470 [Candidatus Hydrogenedentota bacterium]